MSLLSQAASDLQGIVENTGGFASPVTLTTPGKVAHSLVGTSADIGQTIDPETGVPVAGRRASVAFSWLTLHARGLDPKGVEEGSPWTVQFADVAGSSHTYKIVETIPDRTLGMLVCILEFYR